MAGRTLLTLIAIQAVTVIPFTPASAGDVGLALVRAVPKAEASIRERTYFPLVATPVDPVTGREIVWRPNRFNQVIDSRALIHELKRLVIETLQILRRAQERKAGVPMKTKRIRDR